MSNGFAVAKRVQRVYKLGHLVYNWSGGPWSGGQMPLIIGSLSKHNILYEEET